MLNHRLRHQEQYAGKNLKYATTELVISIKETFRKSCKAKNQNSAKICQNGKENAIILTPAK